MYVAVNIVVGGAETVQTYIYNWSGGETDSSWYAGLQRENSETGIARTSKEVADAVPALTGYKGRLYGLGHRRWNAVGAGHNEAYIFGAGHEWLLLRDGPDGPDPAGGEWTGALFNYNGNAYCFYGENGSKRIWHALFKWREEADSAPHWVDSGQVVTGGDPSAGVPETDNGPEALMYQGKLHLFFRGVGDPALWWMSAHPAASGSVDHYWTRPVALPETSGKFRPTATVHAGLLWVFWVGGGDPGNIWYITYDGNAWSLPQIMPGTIRTKRNPAVAPLYDQLLLTWFED